MFCKIYVPFANGVLITYVDTATQQNTVLYYIDCDECIQQFLLVAIPTEEVASNINLHHQLLLHFDPDMA